MNPHPVLEPKLPGSDLDMSKMPGHWLLAKLGKRVLRPGGLGMTEMLLKEIAISDKDMVVEFAPGLGITAQKILEAHPHSYTGVEHDSTAVEWTRRHLPQADNITVIRGQAENTSLEAKSASVVIGEAMLSMNTQEHKQKIVREASRLLRVGGYYGIHELCIVPDDMKESEKKEIDHTLSSVIHVGARPLRTQEWRVLLEESGFKILKIGHAPMHLLNPKRLIQDEGIMGALRFAKNLVINTTARRRVLAMRSVFQRYRDNLNAIFIIAEKK